MNASAACNRNQVKDTAGGALSAFSRQPAVLFCKMKNLSGWIETLHVHAEPLNAASPDQL
jgi:hypothetical protein